MKICKNCGEEFDFYPGEYCGDCAPKCDMRQITDILVVIFICGAMAGMWLALIIF